MARNLQPRWWGSRKHKIFTIAVFVIISSLDNAVIAIMPPLYGVIGRDLAVSEAALGFMTGARILVSATSAAVWGFWGDRTSRKQLLLYGTLTWSAALFIAGSAQSYGHLFGAMMVAGVGLGCVGSVGFSLAADFIPPGQRGLILSIWAIAQGFGWGTGSVISSTLGAFAWPLPFWLIGLAGLAGLMLYLFSYEPSRGQAEPELAGAFASGQDYGYRIRLADLKQILARRSNIWLALQGFMATPSFGALIWMPRFLAARVEVEGYSLETATTAGSMLYLVFQAGVYIAIPAGYWGDRWQRRNLRGRAIIGAFGNLGMVPFHIAFFLVPLTGLILPEGEGMIPLVWASLTSMLGNGWVALAFVLALGATILSVIDNPNKAALINDVNLPEHRGTAVGMMAIINGIGLSIGNWLAGVAFDYFALQLPSPWNFAVALSLFQLFMIPAGLCYLKLIRTTPHDIQAVRHTLAGRGQLIEAKAKSNENPPHPEAREI
jgi:MFS family permease